MDQPTQHFVMSNFNKLEITLDNICELNHFVYTESSKKHLIGKPYDLLRFHGEEPDAEKNPWKYKINKYGYRGNEWDFDRSSLPFFGCSCTFGTGVEFDIAASVQQISGINCFNLGSPGSSAINVIKTFTAFNKIHPTNYAFITLPQLERLYWPKYNQKTEVWNYTNVLPQWVGPDIKKIHKHLYSFFGFDTCTAYLYDYIQMAEMSAQINNTKIFWSSWDPDTFNVLNLLLGTDKTFICFTAIDYGRDNLHPGPETVKIWTNNINNKIKEYF